MYYVNGRQVKEMLMKGSDGFLHRTTSGYLSNNRKFYSKDASYESPLVDVHVYYKGNRVLTTPQFIKRSELRTTTITVEMNPTVDLKVANATQSGVTSFSGNSGSNPTFKLDPDVILSKPNANVHLLDNPSPASSWVDTHSYSIIFSDYNFTSIPESAVGMDCGFDNAAVYARNSSGTYDLCAVGGLSVLSYGNNNRAAYLNINLIDPPDVSFDGMQSLIHFGYLPKDTADTMGFNANNNPNGVSKESPDYWGWGCWVDGQQWLWSDDELCEFLSSNGVTILRSNNLEDIVNATGITYGDTLHWGVYSINISSEYLTDLNNTPTFMDGWIFARNNGTDEIVSEIYSLENKTLYDVANYDYLTPGLNTTAIMIIPYSQGGQSEADGGQYMGDLITELMSKSMISDFSTYVDQFFNINTQIVGYNSRITGTINVQISSSVSYNYGYLYCSNNLAGSGVLVASRGPNVTGMSSQTFDVGNDGESSIIYLGSRGGDPSSSSSTIGEMISDITLSVTPNFSLDWFNTMIASERFKYYKLIPFVSPASEGNPEAGATIELNQ